MVRWLLQARGVGNLLASLPGAGGFQTEGWEAGASSSYSVLGIIQQRSPSRGRISPEQPQTLD